MKTFIRSLLILFPYFFLLQKQCAGQDAQGHFDFCYYNGNQYRDGATIETSLGKFICSCVRSTTYGPCGRTMSWKKIGEPKYSGGSGGRSEGGSSNSQSYAAFYPLRFVYRPGSFGGREGMWASGNWGGEGTLSIIVPPVGFKRVSTILIGTSGSYIKTLGFRYEMEDGSTTGYTVGSRSTDYSAISLDPDEHITNVAGYHNNSQINSVEFWTNKGRRIGPFGLNSGGRFGIDFTTQANPYICMNRDNVEIIGFRGNASDRVNSLGVIIRCK